MHGWKAGRTDEWTDRKVGWMVGQKVVRRGKSVEPEWVNGIVKMERTFTQNIESR